MGPIRYTWARPICCWRVFACALSLSSSIGCISSRPPQQTPVEPSSSLDIEGVTHTVLAGETLWRIGKTYGVAVEEIMFANNLSDPSQLRPGQQLLIPGVSNHQAGSPHPGDLSVSSPKDIGNNNENSDNNETSTLTKNNETDEDETIDSDSLSSVDNQHILSLFSEQASEHSSPPSSGHFNEENLNSTTHSTLSWPLMGVLYARFGQRGETHHDGIDIASPEGTIIQSAGDGKILFSGYQKGYGNLVIIRHSKRILTIYAHNQRNLVKEGDLVRQGDSIAQVGIASSTSGPHLHFEVRVESIPKDPLLFLPRPR